MSRTYAYRVPADTSLFSPLHLQPTAICRLAFSAAGVWLRRNLVSHRQLVCEHHTGLVLWSVRLEYGDRINFFDAEELEIAVTGRVRSRGAQFEFEVAIGASARAVTRLTACLIPLQLSDDGAFLGTPHGLSQDVMARFLPDEVDHLPHTSSVPRLQAEIEKSALPLARNRSPFVIHRHQCEVADQWFWAEAVSLGESVREELISAEAERFPSLRQALRVPLERLDMVFQRPFYLFDRGVVVSSVHEWRGKLAFVHEFVGSGSMDGRPRTVAIEQFPSEPPA